jgi:hypothetical protein
MSSLDRVQYNAHVALHMQLILILQLLYSADPSTMQWERCAQCGLWLKYTLILVLLLV